MKNFWPLAALLPALALAADYRGVVGVDYSQDAGNVFYCANAPGTPVTTQAGVSVSSPTLALGNPFGSGKNLTVLAVSVQETAFPATPAVVLLAYNVVPSSGVVITTNTPATAGLMTSALVGKSTSTATTTSIAKCTVQGFLPALPTGFRYEGTLSTQTPNGVFDPVNGQVVIPPGGVVSVQTTAAISALANFVWREDPQ